MARSIPKTPNVNTRRPMMTLLPMNQRILHIPATELDEWGYDRETGTTGTWYDCKIQYGQNRFFLRHHAGYEHEDATYVMLAGKVKVTTSDILRYTFPDGDEVDLKPQQITHVFDMQGGVFITKVWCK